MIIEPTPTNPRSPVRRALRLAGLLLPVVLFAGVLTAGLAGPRPEPVAPDASGGPVAPNAPSGSLVPVPSAVPAAVVPPGGPGRAFPAVAADLSVLSVAEAQDALAAGTGALSRWPVTSRTSRRSANAPWRAATRAAP